MLNFQNQTNSENQKNAEKIKFQSITRKFEEAVILKFSATYLDFLQENWRKFAKINRCGNRPRGLPGPGRPKPSSAGPFREEQGPIKGRFITWRNSDITFEAFLLIICNFNALMIGCEDLCCELAPNIVNCFSNARETCELCSQHLRKIRHPERSPRYLSNPLETYFIRYDIQDRKLE